MSKKDVVVGIDVGSSNIRTVIAQIFEEEKPRIVGVGVSDSLGVRKGIVVDIEETVRSINESLEKAERSTGIRIEDAIVSVGGSHISSQSSKGLVAVGRADGEVTEEDINRVVDSAQAIPIPPNKEIIHIVPKDYTLDEQRHIKDPVGMNGLRLEVETLIIEGSTPYLKSLAKCFSQANINVTDFVLAPLAASRASLTKRQKELGVALVDIGGGTTSIAVFEENDLLHTAIIPVGGSHITNDIAIGLRTSIDVAEKVKLEYGSALPAEIGKKEDINLAEIDANEEGIVSRYHVAEIIQARLEEILNMVNKELKSIGKDKLLPAGVVLSGGTAKIPGIVDLAKEILGLPAQTGFPIPLGGLVDKVDEPSFVTSVGLVLWGTDSMSGLPSGGDAKGRMAEMISKKLKNSLEKPRKWLSKFLP